MRGKGCQPTAVLLLLVVVLLLLLLLLLLPLLWRLQACSHMRVCSTVQCGPTCILKQCLLTASGLHCPLLAGPPSASRAGRAWVAP